jgi:iron complex outermembrane receptor protein
VTNYELGAKTQWFDNRVRINVDFSHRAQKDTQSQFLYTGQPTAPVAPGTPFGTLILNDPSARSYFNSFEVETITVPFPNATVGINLGLESAPTVAGLVSNRPKYNLGFNASYDFPKFGNGMYFSYRFDGAYIAEHNSGLSATLLAVSSPALLRAVSVKGEFRMDMRLSLMDVQLGAATAKLAVWGKNITNTHTLNIVQDFGTNIVGTYNVPRTYGVDLIVDF